MTKHLLGWAVVIIAVCLCFWSVAQCYAVEKKLLLKDNADSYVVQLSPDTNYGTASELISQIKFTFDGVNRINYDDKIAYVHYIFPSEVTGKVTVLAARCYFYVNYYKGYSPYPETEATYSAGVYPCLSEWTEYGITYNNQPTSSGPPLYEFANAKHTFAHSGWNKFDIDSYGLTLLQSFLDSGQSFGFAWYVDVSPTISGTLAVGDYLLKMSIASRESGNPSYIVVDVEITGMVNSTIMPQSLGNIKATYQ